MSRRYHPIPALLVVTAMAVLLLVSPGTAVQVPPLMAWNHTAGGSGSDGAAAIAATEDGGCIVAGSSTSSNGDLSGNHGGNDFWVVKMSPAGTIEWSRTYGGSREDLATAITLSADGTGYFVAGSSTSTDGDVSGNHGGTDYLVMKLDNSGAIVWNRTYGGSGDEKAAAILSTPGGGCVVAGSANTIRNGDVSGNHGLEDYWVVNLSSAGDIVWNRTYGGSRSDKATAITSTGNGYLVVGSSFSGTPTQHDGQVSGNYGSADYWVTHLSMDGSLLGERHFGGYYGDTPTAVTRIDGGYLIAGSTGSSDQDVGGSHGLIDCWVIRVDDGLGLVWGQCYGGSRDDYVMAIAPTDEEGCVMVGRTNSLDGDVAGRNGTTQDTDFWTIKLDSSGDILWQACYGGSKTDAGTAVTCASDGGYLLGGSSASSDGNLTANLGGNDCWVVKLEGPVPTITSFAPNNGSAGSTTPLPFMITGTGLSSPSVVALTSAGCHLPVTVAASNSTSIIGTLNLSSALPGSYELNVTGLAGRTVSFPDAFLVEPAVTTPITTTTTTTTTLPETTRPTPTEVIPPAVSSVSPSSALAGTTPGVVLTGEHFEEGLSVYLVRNGSSPVAGSVVNVTPTAITCMFDLAGIDAGSWNVMVINPGGADSSASYPGAFQVEPVVTLSTTAPTAITTSPIPTIPVPEVTWSSPPVCIPPVFSSVSPSSAQAGTTSTVTMGGENFEEGLSVYLVRDCSAPVTGHVVNVSPTSITCTFCLVGISTGSWNVLVVNADGAAFGRGDAFMVIPPQLAVVPIPPSVLVPTAPERDGVCWDLDGNGEVAFSDVVLYFNQMDWIAENEPVGAFDFTRDGQIEFSDVVAAFNRL